jgi:hypothetical protein
VRIALTALALTLAVATAAPAKTLARYDRSGGIAGEITTLTVGGHGHAVKTERGEVTRRFVLSERRLHRLKRVLREADFATLDRDYGPDVIVPDGISESVTHNGRSVSTATGGNPPARFERVLAKLRALTQ